MLCQNRDVLEDEIWLNLAVTTYPDYYFAMSVGQGCVEARGNNLLRVVDQHQVGVLCL